MRIQTHPYFLEFKKPFKLAHGERKGTHLVFVEINHEGYIGWGEASLPPYRKETTNSVIKWINQNQEFDLPSQFSLHPNELDIPYSIDNPAASCALEMAVLDWVAKSKKTHLSASFSIENKNPCLTLTITKNDYEDLENKLQLADNFTHFKLKLTGDDDDIDFVKAIRKKTDLPFCIDYNQGHSKKEKAIQDIEKLIKENCILIEQPLKDFDHEGHFWLKSRTEIPIIADESIQNLNDLIQYHDAYSGINVKLMKCGGLSHAHQMLQKAKELHSIPLLGCMSESSLGVAAASLLAPICWMADLDSPYLNQNDPFEGFHIEQKVIKTYFNEGFGVNRKPDF